MEVRQRVGWTDGWTDEGLRYRPETAERERDGQVDKERQCREERWMEVELHGFRMRMTSFNHRGRMERRREAEKERRKE